MFKNNTLGSKILNFALLAALILLLFTPAGTTLKIHANRLLASSPSVIKTEDRVLLSNTNWKLLNPEGQTLSFDQFKGKVVILNFWATWCPPCLAEMPSLQKLHSDYKNKVAFVLVSNEDQKKVQTFLEKENYQLPNYLPLGELPPELFSKSIPATFIIDSNGYIVSKKVGAANWNSSKVRETLDELVNHITLSYN